ncbi:MAG TPA: DUF4097 family beta strand repeat-containing protein [Acidobacteriota bacterium]|jgi:DUF4097 and DUF4098 domain-containing protein YvlB|nr:DUF4097 family beta strand repeat-containing protein [Acidobacteriota bacterium]HNT17521.1 DUF4097 family beta strand repeat-containing protein [Acidobacteriota bacterium]HQO19881.1 DUF4097 family beta strand repeat-containing protein [Acidobacteriota bacterium]HQQ46696.1 DUF4097 family beta strand repeat-containing protein [Acidobacteriota bacterium]
MNRKHLTIFFAGLLVAVFTFGATLSETVNKEFPFPKSGKLTIENVNGRIIVEQWEKDSVKIEAVKTAKGSSDENTRKALQDTKVEFLAEGGNVSVTVRHPQSGSFFSWLWGTNASVEVAFRVWAPASSKLSLSSVNGDVQVSVKGADVEAETVNGSVTIKGSSLVTISTVNGSIDFDSDNLVNVESVNGQINAVLRSDKPKNGTLEVVNGSIVVKLPAGSSFSVTTETVNGSIESDFPEVTGSRREKSGDIGSGGDKLSIETVNGSIEIRKN